MGIANIFHQLISSKAREIGESTHEKASQIAKTDVELMKHMELEKKLEVELEQAFARRDKVAVERIQAQLIDLAQHVLKELNHMIVETFALTADQRNIIQKETYEVQKIIQGGLRTPAEQDTLNRLKDSGHKISDLLRDVRFTASVKR